MSSVNLRLITRKPPISARAIAEADCNISAVSACHPGHFYAEFTRLLFGVGPLLAAEKHTQIQLVTNTKTRRYDSASKCYGRAVTLADGQQRGVKFLSDALLLSAADL